MKGSRSQVEQPPRLRSFGSSCVKQDKCGSKNNLLGLGKEKLQLCLDVFRGKQEIGNSSATVEPQQEEL